MYGDFNVVRLPNERKGSVFFQIETNDFNNFIINTELTDVPMGGRRYSKADKLCS